ncbi:hypothetical protein EV2_036566 [Malus domestica]
MYMVAAVGFSGKRGNYCDWWLTRGLLKWSIILASFSALPFHNLTKWVGLFGQVLAWKFQGSILLIIIPINSHKPLHIFFAAQQIVLIKESFLHSIF